MGDLDPVGDDEQTLHRLGYAQELLRRMSGFSNFAISLSIICILAGGITSFHQGFCSVGGAAIGIGWPVACLFSLAVAATMGQVASAFPTAGGLYHWASILGGRGWGWATAWFNLAGVIFVLDAINVGFYQFVFGQLGPFVGIDPADMASYQLAAVAVITFSQALLNHLGIRLVSILTDFSGYLILVVAALLTVVLLIYAPSLDFARLVTFTNYSGHPLPPAGHPVWPHTTNLAWLFALGLVLPAYTITGFDASAHTAEETVNAGQNVPRGIVRSVLVSGIFGWVMIAAILLAMPSLDNAAEQGDQVVMWTMLEVLPHGLAILLFIGIALAQYLAGLATVTSASRMTYAFARDGGLPASHWLRQISGVYRTPPFAIWAVAVVGVLFSIYTPVYETIIILSAVFLYISYVLPSLLGFFAHGRSWTRMGPWNLGGWFRPLALVGVAGCGLLLAICMAPPNEKAFMITAAASIALGIVWFAFERRRFRGPPVQMMNLERPDKN
jgi:amino acid transporter